VIAGDDRARLVATGARPGGVAHAAHRRDDELVRGQHQLGAHAVAGRRMRGRHETAQATALGLQRGGGIERGDGLPRLGGRDQRDGLADGDVGAKISRAPQVAA
jgi:hypothetical protein